MPADGILTTIDLETEHQRAAREAFAAAGIAHQRTRVIAGRALEVLPRMTDGAYDLVFVDADKRAYPDYLAQATRLLRRGGTLAMTWSDKESDPPTGTPRRARCARSAAPSATTTSSPSRCFPSARACSSPSSVDQVCRVASHPAYLITGAGTRDGPRP